MARRQYGKHPAIRELIHHEPQAGWGVPTRELNRGVQDQLRDARGQFPRRQLGKRHDFARDVAFQPNHEMRVRVYHCLQEVEAKVATIKNISPAPAKVRAAAAFRSWTLSAAVKTNWRGMPCTQSNMQVILAAPVCFR